MLRTLINTYLFTSIVIIFALGYIANIAVNWSEMKAFMRKGERHTLEHAIKDCKYINQVATQINLEPRDCENLYER